MGARKCSSWAFTNRLKEALKFPEYTVNNNIVIRKWKMKLWSNCRECNEYQIEKQECENNNEADFLKFIPSEKKNCKANKEGQKII